MSEAEFLQRLKETGRNDTCPCGSGKKYKKCHLREDEDAERKWLAEQEKVKAQEADEEESEEGDEQSGFEARSKARKDEGRPGPRSFGSRGGSKQTIMPRRSGRGR